MNGTEYGLIDAILVDDKAGGHGHCCACKRPDLPIGSLCRSSCMGEFCVAHFKAWLENPDLDASPPLSSLQLTEEKTCVACGDIFRVSLTGGRGRPRMYCTTACARKAGDKRKKARS